MNIKCLLIIASCFLPDLSFAATSITQYGITWTFAEPVVSGQFVNGDYWVVDPGSGVKIVNISPGSTTHPTTGLPINGSMLNPATALQGYDGYMNYDAAKNIGIGISAENPLTLHGDVSLVSTISNLTPGQQPNGDHWAYVDYAAVLTCLSTVPPAGSFRPGISSTSKTIHNISSINYSKLRSLTLPVAKVSLEPYINYLKMTWLTHDGSYTSRYMHPQASGLDSYYYAPKFATIAKLLHLDYDLETKKPLLYNFMQLGIDIYSYIESGGKGWAPDGGHSNGRKWPVLFTGIMLNYTPMKNIGQKSGDYLYATGYGAGHPPPDYIHFGEDGQTFHVTQADVDITNSPAWNPDTRYHTVAPYSTAMLGMPEWGLRASTNPEQSDASWQAAYRTIGTAMPSWEGFAISALLMDAKSLWNHNAFFDYVDRYMAISRGNADPFGYTVPGQASGSPVTSLTWDLYRSGVGGSNHLRLKANGKFLRVGQ